MLMSIYQASTYTKTTSFASWRLASQLGFTSQRLSRHPTKNRTRTRLPFRSQIRLPVHLRRIHFTHRRKFQSRWSDRCNILRLNDVPHPIHERLIHVRIHAILLHRSATPSWDRKPDQGKEVHGIAPCLPAAIFLDAGLGETVGVDDV